jgi:hypothetical protein
MMATGLQQYEPFANAIEQAEAHLYALGARWSLKGMLLYLCPYVMKLTPNRGAWPVGCHYTYQRG